MTPAQTTTAEAETIEAFEKSADTLQNIRKEIGAVILGQDRVVDQTLVTLLSGGHVLLIGVPGLAKTLLVDTVAKVLGLTSSRVQCTPDLMPADVLGSEVLEESDKGKRAFRFIEGPVFAQFLMVDEINRASPRTQSALLQAMQEKQVSVSGKNHDLPKPFHVLATQNPIEQEGTYPLPEAQLDRFLMQVDVGYPDLDTERRVIMATTTGQQKEVNAIASDKDLMEMQALVRDMPIGEQVVETILTLVRRGRPVEEAPELVREYVVWAPGPRASQALMLACRAKALLEGRPAPSPEDALALAEPVLKHRMALSYKARANGVHLRDVIAEMRAGL